MKVYEKYFERFSHLYKFSMLYSVDQQKAAKIVANNFNISSINWCLKRTAETNKKENELGNTVK